MLPGIGPIATIAMLLPLTFHLEPVSGLIMLAGIFYGAQYGGSTTAILVNLPGETSSVVTCIDGHQMARQGRAGAALAVAALGSFFAGCVTTALIATFAPPLAMVGQSFGAPEYFSLMVLGLIAAVVLAHGSVIKAVAMIILGLLVGLVGTDGNTGGTRFTFGITRTDRRHRCRDARDRRVRRRRDHRQSGAAARRSARWSRRRSRGCGRRARTSAASWPAVLRGTASARCSACCPAAARRSSSFAAYALEKKVARDPSRFGHGAVEGVAGPESANNAGAQTSFIPMLTLGIPGNAVMALMIGALTIHGIQPGPQIMTERPQMFWGMVAIMWIGNLMLVIINLPLIGIWVQLLKVPYRFLYLAILLFCASASTPSNNSAAAVLLAALFGVLGYIFMRLDCEPAPMILGFVLGPLMEENLRRAMRISRRRPDDLPQPPDQPRPADRRAGAARAGAAAEFRRGRERRSKRPYVISGTGNESHRRPCPHPRRGDHGLLQQGGARSRIGSTRIDAGVRRARGRGRGLSAVPARRLGPGEALQGHGRGRQSTCRSSPTRRRPSSTTRSPRSRRRPCGAAERPDRQAVAAHPDRFIGIATLPMQAPKLAADELAPRDAQLGLRGRADRLQHQRPESRRPQRSSRSGPTAAELGAFIMVHPVGVAGADRLKSYYLANLIGNPLDTTIAAASLVFGGVSSATRA